MVERAPPVLWVLTDGKAGDEQPLIGLAEAMGVVPLLRRVAPRRVFAWLMPRGPIDPKDTHSKSGSPLAGPWPDICLATGRRSVPYLRKLKAHSPSTFCVFFKDPRIRAHGADLLIVQQHDSRRGDDVLVVTTGPNRLSPERLTKARAASESMLAPLPQPRIAVLVGGNSKHHCFTKADADRLLNGLHAKLREGCALMITTSRRTPSSLSIPLADLGSEAHVRFWDGVGENPLLAYLSWADEIVVTADSTNMVGEAAALGVPVQIFYPSGGHAKIERFIAALSQEAALGRFPEAPAAGNRPPVNSTYGLAEKVLARWREFRSPPAPPSSPAGSSASS